MIFVSKIRKKYAFDLYKKQSPFDIGGHKREIDTKGPSNS